MTTNESTWGVVEIMGRRQVAGLLSEVPKFGTVLLEVRIPQLDGSFVVQQFGGAAIYAVHYTSEAKARELAPHSLVIIDKALPAPYEEDPRGPGPGANDDSTDGEGYIERDDDDDDDDEEGDLDEESDVNEMGEEFDDDEEIEDEEQPEDHTGGPGRLPDDDRFRTTHDAHA